MNLVCLLKCFIWTMQTFLKRPYIIWEVLYSITWISWRSMLVKINFHVIQFPLMSVFLHNEMKFYLLDICLFLLFAKIIPEKVLIWQVLLECNDINVDLYFIVWVTLKYFIGWNFVSENFSIIHKNMLSLFSHGIFPN